MIKLTIEQWAIGKFCIECSDRLIPSVEGTGLVCTNATCSRLNVVCCKKEWAKALEQIEKPEQPTTNVTIRMLPWLCGHCGTPTCDTLTVAYIGDYKYLQATCSKCQAKWLTCEQPI